MLTQSAEDTLGILGCGITNSGQITLADVCRTVTDDTLKDCLLYTSQQLHVNDIFQDKVDIFHVSAEHRLTDAMIGHIVFFVDSQDFLSLKVLALYLIEQERIGAGLDIVQHRFR